MKQSVLCVALFGVIALPFYAYAETLDEVVVTATRFKDVSVDKPINVTVISQSAEQCADTAGIAV